MDNLVHQLRRHKLVLDSGAALGWFVLKGLYRSLRTYHFYQDKEAIEALVREGKRWIFCFWHGRLLMMLFLTPIRDVAIMISQHRDGDLVARFTERSGCKNVRGSATRGSLGAMKQMIASYRKGLHLVMTPDGPRGPIHQVKSGVIELAKLTGAPIVPVTFGAFPRKVLSSWDEFVIPLPFGTCTFVWGEPLWISSEAGKEEMSEAQKVLQARLMEIDYRADELSRELDRGRRRDGGSLEAELLAEGWSKASE